MFRKILRKKSVLESLYIWRLSSKVTPPLLLLGELCRFFKNTYLVENLRSVTSDRGFFLEVFGGIQKAHSLKIPEFWPHSLPPPLFALVPLYVLEHQSIPPSSNRKVHLSWLELTLSSSISILAKFRENKFIMSTSISVWTQCVF